MADRMPDIQVAVSWNWTINDQFSGDYDILDRRLISNTLSIQYGRDTARPLGEPLSPRASWQALNADRVLSPEWPGSPIYQVLVPGRPNRTRAFLGDALRYDASSDYDAAVDYDDGEGPYPMHSGVLETPEWETALGQPTVSMTSLGAMARLTRKISTPLYSNLRVDECLAVILTPVWSSDLLDLALADTTLDWFWVDDETIFEVLVRLQHTEGVPSLIWEGPDGVLHFEHRNYRNNTARSNTSQATYVDRFDAAPDADPRRYHAGMGYRQPYSDVYNLVTCPIVHRERQSAQQVWEFGGPLVLGANEARNVVAELRDPSDGVIAMANGTDYTVSVGSLATAPAYVETYAQRITVRFVAGAGGATVIGVTSDGPQIRATPVTVISEDVAENTIDTSASIRKYDTAALPIPLELQAYPEISHATAEALCDAAAAYYQEVRPIISLRVMDVDEDHLRDQLIRRPSDLITAISEPLGVEGDMHVEQLAYRATPEGLELILTCERALAQPGAAVWDDPASVWDGPGTLWGN